MQTQMPAAILDEAWPTSRPRSPRVTRVKPSCSAIGPGSAPARQPRLRLRQLNEEELDAAAEALQALADAMASKISDADSWTTGAKVTSNRQSRNASARRCSRTRRSHRSLTASTAATTPPAPSDAHTSAEHRLDEALDDMEAHKQETPRDQRAVRRARRRVGRVRASMAQQGAAPSVRQDEAKWRGPRYWPVPRRRRQRRSTLNVPNRRRRCNAHFTGPNAPRTDFRL
ncbi:hypothetical protein Pcac1_g29066 [Phytophthora cactorum]|nr:hypothetical protein Pcac1_g29066 [Phytophthora cactorum]